MVHVKADGRSPYQLGNKPGEHKGDVKVVRGNPGTTWIAHSQDCTIMPIGLFFTTVKGCKVFISAGNYSIEDADG